MFGLNNNEYPFNYFSEFQYNFLLPDTDQIFPSLLLPPDSLKSEHEYTSSGCSSYGGSPTSINNYGTYISTQCSHSFQSNYLYSSYPQGPYFELEETRSVKKPLSNGDLLQERVMNLGYRANNPLAATESSIIESMNRANPYSPEEKKERIERYRNKRTLRNFHKKIKYECRKTLADSRPRIRGRFARTDDIERTLHQSQWIEENDEEYQNWVTFLDAFSANMTP